MNEERNQKKYAGARVCRRFDFIQYKDPNQQICSANLGVLSVFDGENNEWNRRYRYLSEKYKLWCSNLNTRNDLRFFFLFFFFWCAFGDDVIVICSTYKISCIIYYPETIMHIGWDMSRLLISQRQFNVKE